MKSSELEFSAVEGLVCTTLNPEVCFILEVEWVKPVFARGEDRLSTICGTNKTAKLQDASICRNLNKPRLENACNHGREVILVGKGD